MGRYTVNALRNLTSLRHEKYENGFVYRELKFENPK